MAIDVKKILGGSNNPDWVGPKMIELLQYRIEQEELSSRIYRAMSFYLNLKGFSGGAALWMAYSKEEQKHADEFSEYLLDLNVMPNVPMLAKQSTEFTGLKDIAQRSLQHELEISRQINVLASEAMKVGDFMAMQLAQQYLMEQKEEISKTRYWVDRLEICGDNAAAILEIDEEMGDKVG